MSDPAADAIARAKEIAARLAGNGGALPPPPSDPAAVAEAALAAAFGSSSGGGEMQQPKKRRWGGDAAAAEDAVAAAMSMKRPKSSNTERKVFIPVDQNPGYNYIGLLIGPGGSKQRDLIDQAGGNVKISIRGRGSSSNSGEQEDEPLHVLLEGSVECVEKAEQLVNELLHDSDKANAEKDRQLAQVNNARSSSTATPGSVSTYQPKPVAQLLGIQQQQAQQQQDAIEEKIGVPNGVVGYIIGKGGESITSMQRRSGCRVQIQKEHEMDAGSTQRIITLTAATQESIAQCRAIIEGMVQERLRLNQEQQQHPTGGSMRGGTGGANAAAQAVQLQQALAEGQALVKVPVPNADVGLIIGKGGTTIRSIQDRSGANIQIPQGPDADNPAVRTISVTHPQSEGAEFAKTLIEEVLQSKANFQQNHQQNNTYTSNNARQPNPGDISMQIQIPDKDVGMCIGRGGCVIREMQGKTHTRIQIPSMPTPGQMYRIATITGPAEGCQKVSDIITRISAEQSSQFVITGAAFSQQQPSYNAYGSYPQQQQYGGYGQQQQQQQQQQAYGSYAYGQQQPAASAATTAQTQGAAKSDYSAEWAAYYAAQAASTGQATSTTAAAAATPAAAVAATTAAAPAAAAATATAATAAVAGATTADSQQPAADAYHDAFFRYAYHYGDEAARQYYGAWSPAQGTPNPYGTNPNLSTAPAAAPAAATAEIKDSSVRNVSNLPAWMTKS